MKIKVMPDYKAYALWDDEFATGDIDPETLPLSKDLVLELKRWSDFYEQKLDWDDPAADHWTQAEELDFEAKGRVLASRVAKELGAAYCVRYWQDPKGHREPH
jgi:hypothetical protein